MVLGEVGTLPIEITIKLRMLSFWYKLHCDSFSFFTSDKISCHLYSLCNRQYEKTDFRLPWLKHIFCLLDSLGLSFLKFSNVYSLEQLKKIVTQRLKDQYMQSWSSIINESEHCCNYRLYKECFIIEKYLLILPYSLQHVFTRFRTNNHRFPVETGRWSNISIDDRKCNRCDLDEIGDEFHYLLKCNCPVIKENRIKCIKKCYWQHPNTLKFKALMNTENKSEMINLAKFVKIILEVIK